MMQIVAGFGVPHTPIFPFFVKRDGPDCEIAKLFGAQKAELAEVRPDIIVMFDEYCLARILYALLDNACKFTPTGTIHVKLYPHGRKRVRLEVGDGRVLGFAEKPRWRRWSLPWAWTTRPSCDPTT